MVGITHTLSSKTWVSASFSRKENMIKLNSNYHFSRQLQVTLLTNNSGQKLASDKKLMISKKCEDYCLFLGRAGT